MKIKYGKIYVDGRDNRVQVIKSKTDLYWRGYELERGTYMGAYNEDGTSHDGMGYKDNLIYEELSEGI